VISGKSLIHTGRRWDKMIVLLTDFGQSEYVGVMKGVILGINPEARIIDISHDIPSFNIVEAAFVLRHAYPSYPEGTVHCVIVQKRTTDQQLLCVRHNGHYFLAPDNGLATLMFDEIEECVAVERKDGEHNWQKRVSRAVKRLQEDPDLTALGEKVEEPVKLIHLHPVVTNDLIRGAAIHIDSYDNVIFNISRELFESVSKGRPFKIYYKRHDPVMEIREDYYDVPVGEVICRFNDRGLLELGMNMDRAASLLGIKIDDTVQIHFGDNI
jgi:S-adenosylmethionine hydrolase